MEFNEAIFNSCLRTVSRRGYSQVALDNKGIAPIKTSTPHGNTIRFRELNLSEISGGYAYFTATIGDIQSIIDSKSIILINSTEGCDGNQILNTKSFMSGIILLAAVHLNKYRSRNSYVRGRQHFNIAKNCKGNILSDSTKHHESAGYYYSWRNRGNYRTVNLSSVTQYSEHLNEKN